MREFAERFIKLCLQCEDYSKSGVKKHNKAVKELLELQKKIALDKNSAEALYDILMDCQDERVKSTAAYSLNLNVNITKAQKTLKTIIQSSPEPVAKFNAELTLQLWKEKKKKIK